MVLDDADSLNPGFTKACGSYFIPYSLKYIISYLHVSTLKAEHTQNILVETNSCHFV